MVHRESVPLGNPPDYAFLRARQPLTGSITGADLDRASHAEWPRSRNPRYCPEPRPSGIVMCSWHRQRWDKIGLIERVRKVTSGVSKSHAATSTLRHKTFQNTWLFILQYLRSELIVHKAREQSFLSAIQPCSICSLLQPHVPLLPARYRVYLRCIVCFGPGK